MTLLTAYLTHATCNGLGKVTENQGRTSLLPPAQIGIHNGLNGPGSWK